MLLYPVGVAEISRWLSASDTPGSTSGFPLPLSGLALATGEPSLQRNFDDQ